MTQDFKALEAENKLIKKKLQQTKEAVEFFHDMAKTPYRAFDMQEAAKALGVKGMDKNRLYAFLRNEGVFMSNNQPYQEYIDKGYFTAVVRNKPISYGLETRVKALVFPDGLKFIHSLLKKHTKKQTIVRCSNQIKTKNKPNKELFSYDLLDSFLEIAKKEGVQMIC
ncbi:phage antirepressor KilAC domain-containing protein [Helicobacter cinaedi]|uniref:phage antirepressor KilAC domain-containing protein n=1 Tax=Helicobacter cinaedi TaxID=213 RepID=UPI001FB49A02|nr:phage antirepressor KilAC domain-containing protein [Helicobacter cinaedi]